ncbi:MAG: hypothetical protein ACPIOQ_48470 [Promethearchaeia archaeon]
MGPRPPPQSPWSHVRAAYAALNRHAAISNSRAQVVDGMAMAVDLSEYVYMSVI